MKAPISALLAILIAPSVSAQAKPLSDADRKEVAELKAKASKLTKEVGNITIHSDLQNSDEAIKLLKQVVDELAGIRERLKSLEDSRDKGDKKTTAISKDVDALKNTKLNGYIQFQYSNTNKTGASQPNAFLVRRARLGLVQTIDPRATLRLSADFAEGTSRMDTRLKDAILDYNLAPSLGIASKISFGQMPIPIGYDLERSDADRELPERATYNRTMFNSERSRGVVVRANPDKHVEVGLGAMNSLSTDDPEQTGLAPGQGNKIAALGYIRALGPGYRLGVSGFAGQRPAFTANSITSPQVDRQFLYFDGEYHPTFVPKLTLRGETMIGKDRVPSATAAVTKTAKNMTGFQTQATYDLTAQHQLSFRWEQFNPDRDGGGKLLNGYGLAYQYFLSPMAKFQFAHELFSDDSRASVNQVHYFQTTLRIQFRF